MTKNCCCYKSWLGAHGNIPTIHYDASHNLLAQCSGRKRIFL
ncbi:hypothetical protein F7734_58705 [Scytonema sp. UIC 10036]|nr:hypothetical protein [Scytonema sp. UIC 10036]